MTDAYRSYREQTAHYFARPHEAPPRAPIAGPAAWLGEEMRHRDDWREGLGADAVAEIEQALEAGRRTGKPLAEWTPADFPLPKLGEAIARWRAEIQRGRGFVLISGLPVARWSAEDAEHVFWALGLHLGTPGAQNPQGDLLGHVTDTGDDAADPLVRLYRTSSNIAYHCDAADAVGLLCLEAAPEGGASRIASSVTVWNLLFAEHPELAHRLFAPVRLDLRNEERPGMDPWIEIPPCAHGDGVLRTFYHSDYFRSAERHPGVAFSADERALFDAYEEIASRPEVRLDMELAPGDVQLLSNHTILHARTAYRDGAASRRHLLRLWLSL